MWRLIKDYIDSMHGKTGPKLDDCFSSHYQYEELLTAITCLVKVPTLSICRTFEKITKYAQHKVLGHMTSLQHYITVVVLRYKCSEKP